MINKTLIDEFRFIILKTTDISRYCGVTEILALKSILNTIDLGRKAHDKSNRHYICISDAWEEEYEIARLMVEDRIIK